MTKICFFNREILETTFSAIALTLLREIRLKCTSRGIGDFWVLINLLNFNEPYEMFIFQSFLYLFKGAKRMDFVLSSPKCPKWPSKSRENSFHANSRIKSLPNIINWLLQSCGLMRCLPIEKFITHTSPYKYFQPSLLNQNTKVSQGAMSDSQIRPNKLKTTLCPCGQETWIPNYFKTNTVGYSHHSNLKK